MRMKVLLRYDTIPLGGVFVDGKNRYIKIGDSHSINQKTGLDFIPRLQDKFLVIGMRKNPQTLDPIAFQGTERS